MDQVSWFEPCDHYIDYNNLSVLVLQVLGTAPYNLTTEADDRECVAMGHFKRPGSNQPGSQGGGSEANSR